MEQHFAPLVQPAKFLLKALTQVTIVNIATLDSTNQARLDAPAVRPMHGRLKGVHPRRIVNATMAPQGPTEAPAHSAWRENTRTRGVCG